MKTLNIVFAGTPEFGLPCLEALRHSPHHLAAIFTQPDRPSGRGRALQGSAVKEWALKQGLPVYQPLNFKEEASVLDLARLKPDVLVVIAYGIILPERILNIPSLGCINVHASLLPRWRGASPIQQAVLAGDAHSGISIMRMDKGMDTGDVIAEISCALDARETSASLHDKLAKMAPQALLDTLEALAEGRASFQAQETSAATYALKIQKADALIHWEDTATNIDQMIRAYNPWPVAFTHLGQEIVRIHEALPVLMTNTKAPGTILDGDASGLLVACGEHCLRISKLQFPGGKVIAVKDYLHAHPKATLLHQAFS